MRKRHNIACERQIYDHEKTTIRIVFFAGFHNEAKSLCCGFSENDVAQIGVVKFPKFVPPSNVGIVYKWYALHPKADKYWDTPVPARKVPVPWDGNYRVYVVVSFVEKETYRTVATYRSNTIVLEVKNCDNASSGPN
jgi:hypothetical protein